MTCFRHVLLVCCLTLPATLSAADDPPTTYTYGLNDLLTAESEHRVLPPCRIMTTPAPDAAPDAAVPGQSQVEALIGNLFRQVMAGDMDARGVMRGTTWQLTTRSSLQKQVEQALARASHLANLQAQLAVATIEMPPAHRQRAYPLTHLEWRDTGRQDCAATVITRKDTDALVKRIRDDATPGVKIVQLPAHSVRAGGVMRWRDQMQQAWRHPGHDPRQPDPVPEVLRLGDQLDIQVMPCDDGGNIPLKVDATRIGLASSVTVTDTQGLVPDWRLPATCTRHDRVEISVPDGGTLLIRTSVGVNDQHQAGNGFILISADLVRFD